MTNYNWGFPGIWGYANGVPYTNFHELNMDWILNALQKFNTDLQEIPSEIEEQLKNALDQMEFDQIIADYLATMGVINVKIPPNGLTPASGNGTTDDTATIQGCIDYAAANGGGTVFLPNGSYLTGPLTLKDRVSILGMDRYSTDLVLKGGATAPLIGGTMTNSSIRNIHLNGNSGAQTSNINVVELTAKNLLIDNVIIDNGYKLLQLTTNGGTWQLTNIIFENAGISAAELLEGSAHSNVLAENWHIGYISAINGQYAINNSINDAVFTDLFIETVVPTGVNCSASYCKFTGQIIGAVEPYADLGNMNSFTLVGFSENVKYYKNQKSQAESIERFAETITDVARNIESHAEEENTVSGTDVVLKPTNPITYKTPEMLNSYFNYVPAKDSSGNSYDILVAGDNIDNIGAGVIVDITTRGAVANDNTFDNSSIIKTVCETGYIAFIPEGDFYCATPITLDTKAAIISNGRGRIIFNDRTVGNLITTTHDLYLDSVEICTTAIGTTDDQYAIINAGECKVIAKNCKFHDGLKWNVYVKNDNASYFENCEFYNCENGAGITIASNADAKSGAVFFGCYSHDNHLDGFVNGANSVSYIACKSYNNGLEGTGACGFFMNSNASYSIYDGCESVGNGGIGIEIAGASNYVTITNCLVKDNVRNGIEIRQCFYTIVTNNKLIGNESAQFGGQISYSITAGSSCYSIIADNTIDCQGKSDYGIYAPNAQYVFGINNIINEVSAKVSASQTGYLGAVGGNVYEIFLRKYIRYTDSRLANIVNAGTSNEIFVGCNQNINFVSTSGGFQRVKGMINLTNAALASAEQGDMYVDNSGLHVYTNTWKLIPFS